MRALLPFDEQCGQGHLEVVAQQFEERGFEMTTMDDIAAAVGVGRRTLFRYYPSKNDILWGQFDDSLVESIETVTIRAKWTWERLERAPQFSSDAPTERDPPRGSSR